MRNKLVLTFILSFIIVGAILYFGVGLTFENPVLKFKFFLFNSIISFIITIIAWIFQQKEHPSGLILLFFTEMWERFSYYGMRGLLILYLTKSLIEGGLGFSDENAGLIYGIYTGLVYLTPILGGWLADNYIGQRRSIIIGGILMMLGQFALASQIGVSTFYIGLLLLIIGNGFFKPNISTIVGKLYPAGDPKKDSAFTIFYMGINLGAFLAPLVCGLMAENLFATKITLPDGRASLDYGFEYGFLAAGIGMLLGQITFMALAQRHLGDLGKVPAKVESRLSGNIEDKKPLTKEEKDRVTVIMILVGFVTFFWAGFEQAGSSLSLYTDKFIDREVIKSADETLRFVIPTSWFQSVNPLFIVLLAPIFTILWRVLGKGNREPSVPVKMGLGMILLGLGFLLMVGAVLERGGNSPDELIKANIWWLLGTYFIHTCGELCLSPIGLSMVTKLAPVKLASLLMGVWFLSSFVANFLSGFVVGYVEKLGASTIFAMIAGLVIGIGIILILLSKRLLKMMHGLS